MEKKSDQELMRLITRKDKGALKMLYGRYEMNIYNFVLRLTGNRAIAQELLQETFTRVWFSAQSFEGRRGNFKAWIYTIALNLTRNEMSKKEYSYHYVNPEEMDRSRDRNLVTQFKGPEDLLEKRELCRSIYCALGKLKPYLREIVILKTFQHLKFREIAETTGLPESTLKARYHRAIELLKNELITKEGIPHVYNQ